MAGAAAASSSSTAASSTAEVHDDRLIFGCVCQGCRPVLSPLWCEGQVGGMQENADSSESELFRRRGCVGGLPQPSPTSCSRRVVTRNKLRGVHLAAAWPCWLRETQRKKQAAAETEAAPARVSHKRAAPGAPWWLTEVNLRHAESFSVGREGENGNTGLLRCLFSDGERDGGRNVSWCCV